MIIDIAYTMLPRHRIHKNSTENNKVIYLISTKMARRERRIFLNADSFFSDDETEMENTSAPVQTPRHQQTLPHNLVLTPKSTLLLEEDLLFPVNNSTPSQTKRSSLTNQEVNTRKSDETLSRNMTINLYDLMEKKYDLSKRFAKINY